MPKLLLSLLYRANALPAGEQEYLSWFEDALAERYYMNGVDAYLNGEIDNNGKPIL